MPTSRSEHRRSNTAVGCMSGLFQFLSRRHTHSRKRLTSAKKKEKKTVTIHSTAIQSSFPPISKTPNVQPCNAAQLNSGVHCFVAPRSPTITPQLRSKPATSSVVVAAVDSPRRPSALVARLMGLEDAPESAAEKRRKLMGALEKCDEDLQALRKIIEAVRLVEVKTKTVVGRSTESDGGDQPSPVSVLDAISSPRFRSKRNDEDKTGGRRILKPSRVSGVFSGDRKLENEENFALNKRLVMEVLPRPEKQLTDRKSGNFRRSLGRKIRCLSNALVASVAEVWEDGMWEERREMKRVAFKLEVDIYCDLLEEIVLELLDYDYLFYFRFRTCRKKLCF